MINTTNRRPEEIKRGIKCHVYWGDCSTECPYDDVRNKPEHECIQNMTKDALALIERLETERDAAMTKMPKCISRSAIADILRGKSIDTEEDVRCVAIEIHERLRSFDAAPVVHENWLNTLRDEIHMDAVKHGLWTYTDGPMRCASLIGHEVEELSEAAGNVLDVRCDGGDETEVWSDYCEELADVVIMCFSVAGKLGIDIDAAVRRKMEINKGRPWKHGKE